MPLKFSRMVLATTAAAFTVIVSLSAPSSRLSVAMPDPAPKFNEVRLDKGVPAASSRLRNAPPPTVTLVMAPGALSPPVKFKLLPVPVALSAVVPLSGAAMVIVPPVTDVAPV